MTCTACTFENFPHDVACRACGTETVPSAGSIVRHGSAHDVSDVSYEDRIAEAEARLAALTRHIHAAEAERAAIAQVLASARRSAGEFRRSLGRSSRLAGDSMSPPVPPVLSLEPRPPVLDVGTFRLTFGGSHGTRVDATARAASVAPRGRIVETRWDLPRVDIRPCATAAVWQALENGAPAVRIDGAPGAGASTLLRILAGGAADHGCPDGARLITNVYGPATDIGQRLAAPPPAGETRRYSTAADLRRDLAGVRVLALLDRAQLSAAEQEELVGLFPSFRFVIVDGLAVPKTPTIELGALDALTALSLVEAGYGRKLDGEERGAALALSSAGGSLPGSARLIGIAGAELQRSFVSLDADRGADVLSTFIGSLSPTARCVLDILALARAPMSIECIADAAGSSDVRTTLERLTDCEIVRIVAPSTYELAGPLERYVIESADIDAAVGRLSDALSFDLRSNEDVLDAQLNAAELIVQRAFERSQWKHVLALGPRLAEMFAVRSAFGAWGRVLNLVVAAAKRLDDDASLNLARHELGIRALMLGEYHKATTSLRAAARGWERCGDTAGAAASTTILPLVDRALAASDRALDPRPAAHARAPREPAPPVPALRAPIEIDREPRVAARPFPGSAHRGGQVPPPAAAAAVLHPEPTEASGRSTAARSKAAAASTQTAVAGSANMAATAETAAAARADTAVPALAGPAVVVRTEAAAAAPPAGAAAAAPAVGTSAETEPTAARQAGAPTVAQAETAAAAPAQTAAATPAETAAAAPAKTAAAPPKRRLASPVRRRRRSAPVRSRLRGNFAFSAFALAAIALLTTLLWPQSKETPTISEFSANQVEVAGGLETQLCVTAKDATSVKITPDVGPLPVDGKHCVPVHPLRTTTYTAIAVGSHGKEARYSVTVVPETPVGWPMRIEAFSANPARIHAGRSTRLCYAVSGANLLRIVPSVGNLTQLRSCRTVKLFEPRTYRYSLLAIGEHGEVAVRQARVEVIAAPSSRASPAPFPASKNTPATAPNPNDNAPGSLNVAALPGGWLARKAIYQFDATPAIVEQGQAASLCVGIGRWARGSVTDIGELKPGINRCYRVHPAVTTVYRLHVALDRSVAIESVTVAVQSPSRRHDVARATHR